MNKTKEKNLQVKKINKNKQAKKVILLILDGWGIAKADKYNAIDNANTPIIDKLIRKYPNERLQSQGLAVGLPQGQFGTSEVNHMIIGAGRVILQDLPRINKAINDKTFYDNEVLVNACKHVEKYDSNLHLVGIVSDGGIHSSLKHQKALIELAKKQEIKNLYFHVFTDGRDTPPKSAKKYIKELEKALKHLPNAKIASIQGRFFLDRDRDWEKTTIAVNLLTQAKGMKVKDADSAINYSYNQNITDEFLQQFIIDKKGIIKKHDAIITTHYRTDRMYQLQKALLDKNIPNLYFAGFLSASEEFEIKEAFPRPEINHTLAQTISQAGKTQAHITETEKFTHLTYFFNGGAEKELDKEEWELIKSERFVKPFYNFEPSMRAIDISKKIIQKIHEGKTDFIVANLANCDMVGHTGNYEAAKVAAEAVDYAIGKIYDVIKEKLDEYALIITSDHGNADIMWDYKSNQPHTQHTHSPVPFILISDIECKLDKKESLEDIAPTVLHLMNVEIPDVMTGTSLILEK